LDRRDVREIVRQVVHSGRAWAEKPRYEQIVPAARSEGAKRSERHGNAECKELANRADRDTAWLEPTASSTPKLTSAQGDRAILPGTSAIPPQPPPRANAHDAVSGLRSSRKLSARSADRVRILRGRRRCDQETLSTRPGRKRVIPERQDSQRPPTAAARPQRPRPNATERSRVKRDCCAEPPLAMRNCPTIVESIRSHDEDSCGDLAVLGRRDESDDCATKPDRAGAHARGNVHSAPRTVSRTRGIGQGTRTASPATMTMSCSGLFPDKMAS
jgi:hypothetical protein